MQSRRQVWQQDVVATIVAVAIHALAIGFLLMNLQMSGALDTQPTVAEPIPAEMVDEMATREELTRQAAEERRQREAAERQARLARAEREAEERRQAEIRHQKEEEARREAEEAKRQAAE